MAPVLLLLPEGRGSSKRPVRSAHNMPQRCSYRLKTPRSAISPTESASPTTSVRSPFFKGLGLTGVWGNAASSYTVALTLLPAALLSEISSEDTSPTVGNDSVVPASKRERGVHARYALLGTRSAGGGRRPGDRLGAVPIGPPLALAASRGPGLSHGRLPGP